MPFYDEASSLQLLNNAYEYGINFYDSSNMYGKSEELLGKFIKQGRKDIAISTKGGYEPDGSIDIRPAKIIEAVDTSMKILNTDVIDVYFIPVGNMKLDDISIAFNQLASMKKQGKIRAYGVTTNEPREAQDIIENLSLDVIQAPYNLFDVRFNEEIFPICKKMNIGVVVKSPLNKGFLSGKYLNDYVFKGSDYRSTYLNAKTLIKRNDWLQGYFDEFEVKREELLEMALRFVMSNECVSTTLLGMYTNEQLEKGIKAFHAASLPKALAERMERYSILKRPLIGDVYEKKKS